MRLYRTYEDVKNLLSKEGYVLLSNEYHNTTEKLECLCDKGHKTKITVNQWCSRGDRCDVCKRIKLSELHTIPYDKIKMFFESKGCKLLDENYYGQNVKMKFICYCGKEGVSSYSSFRRNHGCYDCRIKRRFETKKISFESVKETIEKAGCKLLTEESEYKNCFTKLKFICSCGNVGNQNLREFVIGRRCPSCKHRHYSDAIRKYKRNYGPKHHNYNPNLTYEERLHGRNLSDMNIFRSAVYGKDHHLCQKCGYDKGRELNAHHIFSYTHYPHLRIDKDNGITLCKYCHKLFHKKYGRDKNNMYQMKDFLYGLSREDG